MRFLLVLLFLGVVHNLQAQKRTIEVRDVQTKDFPNLSGQLWTRNPDGINTAEVKFFENEKNLDLQFSESKSAKATQENKAILFLVLRSNNAAQLKWYQDVLKSAVESGIIRKGDRYSVASFSVKSGDNFVYPQNLSFSDNQDQVINMINELGKHKVNPAYVGKSQVYLAVNEALQLMQDANISLPKGVFVLSNDQNLAPNFQGENPVERSLKLDIPLYAITYFNNQFSYETPDLCKQTYGIYHTEKGNNVASVSAKLSEFIEQFNNRHAGIYYPFTYKTSLEKDGIEHIVKVTFQSEQTAFSFTSPSKSLSEWIKDNVLLCVSIGIALLLIISGIVFYVGNNNKKKGAAELKRRQHIEELERNQRVSDQQLFQQQQEIQEIRSKEEAAKAEREKEKKKQEQDMEYRLQYQKMLERGNLPWFEYRVGRDSGRYQISGPRLLTGRDGSCDWVVSNPTISRKHFELIFKDYVYTIKDLNSSNGLVVNGQKVNSIELQHGDLIQAGDLIFTFHI